jgi:peptidylprolyl isomerase
MFSRANALVALLLVAAACSGKKPTEKSGAAEKSQAANAPAADASAASAEPVGPKPIPAPPDVAAAPADVETSKTGLKSKVIKPGQGAEHPRAWDQVTVNYTGWTADGKMFDSSLVARGPGHVPAPSTFSLDAVIAGWTEGVQLMVPGETRRFWIPEELAYKGQMGAPQGTLVFDVDLLSMKKNPDPPPVPSDVAAAPADAQKTPSGLMWKSLARGTGKTHPKATDTVKVHYTGWTSDGKMFDSSVVRSEPATFPVDKVIKGWGEGVQLMVTGEKRRFWIPEALAYQGRAGRPQGMLVFDVELVSIVTPETPKDVAAAPKDAETTASGLASKLIKKGMGSEHPSATSTVKVDYSGWTTDGKMFDSSITRGEAAEFPLNGVIAGWTEGVQLMVVGEKRRFWIPEALAYKGQPGAPAGTLVFEIELLEIKK